VTVYNKRTYRVERVDFDRNPGDKFTKGEEEITFAHYYKQAYNVTIQDMN